MSSRPSIRRRFSPSAARGAAADLGAALGMTLVELAATMAIGGILLALSLPAFSRYQESLAARNAFQQLLLDLRLARQAALAEHNNFVVVFASGPPATYAIVSDADNDLVPDPGERRLVERTLPPGIGVDASGLTPADSLAFAPSGRMPDTWTGGEVRLSQSAAEGEPRVLRAWPTGAVEAATPAPPPGD